MSQEVYQPYLNNPGATIQAKRSTFDLSAGFLGTLKSGELVPLWWQEMVPGDTTSINVSTLVRMLTPVVPVMDKAYIDVYLFKVPFRLCMNKENQDKREFQQVMGENISGYGPNSREYEIPSVTASQITTYITGTRTDNKNTVGMYLGLPYMVKTATAGEPTAPYNNNIKITVAPAYAYQFIWNEFFRDEQTQAIQHATADYVYANKCLKVSKFHDLFTDATQRPQLHDPITLNIVENNLPVTTASEMHSVTYSGIKFGTGLDSQTLANNRVLNVSKSTGETAGNIHNNTLYTGATDSTNNFTNETQKITKTNLIVNKDDFNTISINDLRYNIALQSLYEAMNRGGNRYREYLYTVYDTVSDDKTLQIPQYLGGVSIPLEIDTVLQTSNTTEDSALGDTGGFSATSDMNRHMTTISTTEHAILMAVACIRTKQHYFQGIAKKWTHVKQTDFYNPLFEGIGDQPIMESEIYAQTNDVNEVFGYAPAWYEYRSGDQDNVLCGGFNPLTGDQILSKWTYARAYSTKPRLNGEFKWQLSENIAQTLVDENTEDQFLLNVYFDVKCARNMRVSTMPARLLGTL